MKYIKFVTACAVAGCVLAYAGEAEATVRAIDKPAKEAAQAESEKKKPVKPLVKSWPKGGLNIITDKNGIAQDIVLKDGISAASVQKDEQEQRKQDKKERRKDKQAAEAKREQEQKRSQDKQQESKKGSGQFFGGVELPRGYKEISIYGEPVAHKSQAIALIKANNPKVQLACSVEELVDLYWEEAGREQVRPDLALAQSLVETGYYSYGGDVKHHQNNFCGLGTTGGGVRGASFKTPQIGVRAHIQHLLAYTQRNRPQTEIVDPRYELAHNIRMERGVVDTWFGLNGTWAMGSHYCEKIMATYQKMLAQPITELKEAPKAEKEQLEKQSEKKDKQDKKKNNKHRMRELVEKLLRERKR